MSRQWKRKAQVVIGKTGRGLLVENLRIAFEVTKTVDSAPNTAVIKIWNLNPDNENRIKNEYDEVLLNAGYEDSMRLVFRGNIKHVYRYREGNDYITEIEAADGDKDFQSAVMNVTLAAGTTNQQLVERAVGSFSSTKQGYVDVPSKPRLRGKVVTGNTRTVLNEVARDSGANWSIQDGQLTIVPADKMLPNTAIVIRADTGMLSSPEVNDKGVEVECLLNPQIAVNGAIKLDNAGIKAQRTKERQKTKKSGERVVDDPEKVTGDVARLAPDGLYKAIKVIHQGDTRGKDWQTRVLSVAL